MVSGEGQEKRECESIPFCGADRTRTGVQTSQPLAFYMLISLLIVGGKPEKNKPTYHLAE